MAPKGGQGLPVTTEQISCTCGSEDKTVGKSSVLPTPPWLLLLRQQNVAGSGTSRNTILQSFSFHIFFFFHSEKNIIYTSSTHFYLHGPIYSSFFNMNTCHTSFHPSRNLNNLNKKLK